MTALTSLVATKGRTMRMKSNKRGRLRSALVGKHSNPRKTFDATRRHMKLSAKPYALSAHSQSAVPHSMLIVATTLGDMSATFTKRMPKRQMS